MSTIELTNGSATLTARADYLLVVEHGTLSTADEVMRYVIELELAAQRFHLRRLLVDARSEVDDGVDRAEARTAMWRWIRTQRAFDLIGYVLRDEMTIARVNMTALSERLPVRAFDAVGEGHRWLTRARGSSTSIPAAPRGSSSIPPPPMPMRTPMPARLSPAPPAPSAMARAMRETAKTRALSPQEAEAILGRSATPTEPPARNTVKIAALDEKTAEEIRRKR